MLQNSTAAPTTHGSHSSAVPPAHIGGPMRGDDAPHRGQLAARAHTAGWGAATPNAGPARHTHRSQHTLYSVSVVHWVRRDATVRHTAGPRRRGVSAQGVACPPSPAPLQPGPATQVAARIWAHSPCGVVQGLWRCWPGGPGWSACVRPLRGAPPGLQLGGSPGPVPGHRTATTLRARGPPRAPRMHLDSC